MGFDNSRGRIIGSASIWEFGAVFKGRLCEWNDQVFSKNSDGNLNVTFMLSCGQANGKHKTETLTEVWKLIP